MSRLSLRLQVYNNCTKVSLVPCSMPQGCLTGAYTTGCYNRYVYIYNTLCSQVPMLTTVEARPLSR